MNYSFDYDNTLIKYKYVYDHSGEIINVVYDRPHYKNINILRKLHNNGNNVYIITSRIKPKHKDFKYDWDDSPSPEDFIEELSLPVKEIVYTNGHRKIEKLILYDIVKHWDDDEKECEEILKYNNLSYPKFANKQINFVLVSKQEGITERLRDKFLRLAKNER